MNIDAVDAVAKAVLYEGYSLYPYRPSSLKNRQRWTMGGLVPKDSAGGDGWFSQTDCLLRASDRARLSATLRFLQMEENEASYQQAVEREVSVGTDVVAPARVRFSFAGGAQVTGGVLWKRRPISGEVTLNIVPVQEDVFRLRVRVHNTTPLEPAALCSSALALVSLCSAHVVLRIEEGAFISSMDPPGFLRDVVDACENHGAWPVLAGKEGTFDAMLCSPIILYDYPRVAPESKGDLFDSTEIDEILSLRILTLTEAEKAEARAADPRVKAMLERTESLEPTALLSLHGAARGLTAGTKVRLRPDPRGDVMDLALSGKIATIEAVELDFEDRAHLAVTLDEDPGRDLGRAGFPGHRFFFHPHEVEPL